MAVQTSYNVYHDEKYFGSINRLNPHATISKVNNDENNIPYGRFVMDGGGDNQATLPSSFASESDILGVVVRELNRAYSDNEIFGAKIGHDMTVMTHGRIACDPISDVLRGQQVYVVVGDGTLPNENLGKVSGTAGEGTTTAIALTGVKFAESVSSGTPVWVSLGLG